MILPRLSSKQKITINKNKDHPMQFSCRTLFFGKALAFCALTTPLAVDAQSSEAFDNTNHNANFLRCGTKHPSSEEAMMKERHLSNLRGKPGGGDGGSGYIPRPAGSVSVDVYFHVITDNSNNGAVSNGDINNQMNILNAAFAKTPFTFNLVSTTTTANDSWFNLNSGSTEESAMKSALRVGGCRGPQHLCRKHWRRPAGLGNLSQQLCLQPRSRWRGSIDRFIARW
ncbi:hypothetical protein [Microbulbifer sp. 2205BS26-8]|uniref:hypothetical protein n=1 Tax=Microbulbifer sp. 2205BS26-8 TaxID=3064386 RepID=UPI00273D47F0|nr:hypothetical protein [Microbulbifer sp. 2205BS26-8]MDP5210221.1 hypothetical protein [Microbulbifer sp. 2205BS26-8]